MNILITTFTALLYGIAVTILFEYTLKTNKKLRARYYQRHAVIFGYHIHHSTYGLLFIALGIALYLLNKNALNLMFCVFFGFGIIIQHTLSARGRLVFIEKWK
jgi:sensor domain CHASE-containing protein